jgi:four helix bundle protein
MKNGRTLASDATDTKRRDILERSFAFAVRITKLRAHLEERPGIGRVMMAHILRSGTSIPANIEEAQAGQSKADFISKMYIALKEARETHLRLRLVSEADIVSEDRLTPLLAEADELKRIIGAIIVSAKQRATTQ